MGFRQDYRGYDLEVSVIGTDVVVSLHKDRHGIWSQRYRTQHPYSPEEVSTVGEVIEDLDRAIEHYERGLE